MVIGEQRDLVLTVYTCDIAMLLFSKDDYRFLKQKLSQEFGHFLSFVHGKEIFLENGIPTAKN